MRAVEGRSSVRSVLVAALTTLAALAATLSVANSAWGTTASPSWGVEASGPTYFVPSKKGALEAANKGGALETEIRNIGNVGANGITITDTLPAGMKVVEMAKLPSTVQTHKDMAPLELRWCGLGVPGHLCGTEGEGVNLAARPGVCHVSSVGSVQRVECALSESLLDSLASEFGGSGRIEPGQYLGLLASVTVSSSAPEGAAVNRVTASGGGAMPAEGSFESTVASHPSFGISKFSFQTTEAVPQEVDQTHWAFENRPVAFSQAGGHPGALTTTVEWANEDYLTTFGFAPAPIDNPKDVYVTLPPGLLGDPMATPRCPITQALGQRQVGLVCPGATQVGVFVSYFQKGETQLGPIYNITPEAGQSAEFLLTNGEKVNFTLTGHVARVMNPVTKRSEYSLQVSSNGVPNVGLYKIETTFWGDPASETHRAERGLGCSRTEIHTSWQCGKDFGESGNEPSGGPEIPFLIWQSDCSSGGERALIESDSWVDPVRYEDNRLASGSYATAQAPVGAATGCGLLPFGPEIGIEPDTLQADAPVGLGVALKVPQYEGPEELATPEMRKTTISLPPGMSVSPGIVDGIQACEEFGPEGVNMEAPPSGPDESEQVGINGAEQLAPGHCPDASIVGTAEAVTPLLSEPIKGHVYLARPGCGSAALGQAPCTEEDALDGNLYKLYLELGGEGPLANTGVNVKVRLDTEANPATGQLTAVADEIAQLPVSELKVHLNGGPRAPLDNPATCGIATTTADISTWAATGTTPEGVFVHGLAEATPSSFYNVDLAGDGQATPCPRLPFGPGLVAGTVTPNAGKFSAFTMNISRKDREQYVKGVQVHTPPGLLAKISSVPECPEPQADEGTCPEASKIGTTRVASGAGSHPFEIEGDIYLTGPHEGAPFGLSVVTHAVAGPFNLGLVVVRARINIDPNDSTAIITTDETGPYALPQIIFGVPLRLQRITVDVDRPGFMFNPTNCKAQQVTANVSGSQQAVAVVSSPFAVGNCASLRFEPSFKVSTSGHTSRHAGASLDVKLAYPKGAMGSDANIAKVRVELPKQLPSYLATLQKACVDKVFEEDPAHCPPGSIVGVARTTTPVLSTALSGPVYFISHGGKRWPSLIVVLQGDGIRVDLEGETFINEKTGITSSTFKAIPDVPVETFELYLPQGENHALAANGDLCRAASRVRIVKHRITRRVHGKTVHRMVAKRVKGPGLLMPTEFVAQNGVVIHRSTTIVVTGCGKAKAKSARHSGRGR